MVLKLYVYTPVANREMVRSWLSTVARSERVKIDLFWFFSESKELSSMKKEKGKSESTPFMCAVRVINTEELEKSYVAVADNQTNVSRKFCCEKRSGSDRFRAKT